MSDPKDRQNVPAAVRMHRTVVEVGEAAVSEFDGMDQNSSTHAARQDLQIRAAMSKRLLAVLCDKSEGIGELLRGLFCVAHLMLILYRVNGTAFTTSQL